MLYDLKKYGVAAPYIYTNVNYNFQIAANDLQYIYLFNRQLNYPNKQNMYFYDFVDINKYINVNIQSDYLLEKSINGNHVYLKFKNVDNQGSILNYYFIEFLLEIDLDKNIVKLTDFIMYSDKTVNSFTYKFKSGDIEESSNEKSLSGIAIIETQEQANLKTEDVPSYYTFYNNGVKYLNFDNVIMWSIYNFNSSGNKIAKKFSNEIQNLFSIEVIGAIKSDFINVEIVQKNSYRQGLLFSNVFTSLPKLHKNFYVGSKKVTDDTISESLQIDKGNVRIKNNLNWKQAKYIESDNQI